MRLIEISTTEEVSTESEISESNETPMKILHRFCDIIPMITSFLIQFLCIIYNRNFFSGETWFNEVNLAQRFNRHFESKSTFFGLRGPKK